MEHEAPRATVAPADVVGSLLGAVLKRLHLEFAFLRLIDWAGVPVVDTVHAVPSMGRPSQIGGALDTLFGTATARWPSTAEVVLGDGVLFVACLRFALDEKTGVLVVGSAEGFLEQDGWLVLDAVVDQVVIGLKQAQLLCEERRIAFELDERVAPRADELTSTERVSDKGAELRNGVAAAPGGIERRLAVDAIPGLVAVLGTSGQVELQNSRMFEYIGGQMTNWCADGFFHPDDLPLIARTHTQSLVSADPYELEARLLRLDGTYRWVQLRGHPFREKADSATQFVVLITDIDDLKREKDSPRTGEENLKVIIHTMPALVWSVHPNSKSAFFNQHYLDFLGMSTQQARDHWTDALHSDDRDGLMLAWRNIVTSGKAGGGEARLRRHDGEYRWFLFRANPLRDEQGNILHWYGVNTDIEERKRAEAELQRAYRHLTEAQRLSQTGSFTVDIHNDRHTWSDEFYRICEIEPGSAITTQKLRNIVHPEDVTSFDSAMQRAIEDVGTEFSFRIVTSRGVVKHLHGFAHRVSQVADQPVFLGAIQDVTASKLAEEGLSKARSELTHVARVALLNTLTASITHEVNQPLTGIMTNASTCLRMLDSEPPNIDGARETARRTIRDGNRASDVITRLRALFSKKEFTLESMDLNEATREVIAMSLSELKRNHVLVQPELAEDLPPVSGDRIQLQQVLLNLLRNALESMIEIHERPRQLVIRTELEHDHRVRVTVRDAGVGLDPECLDKLFEAFYTTKNGGMGIGLSVSRSIVERHHGRLWAEQNDGPGSTFLFSIPCAPCDEAVTRG